MAIVAGCFVKQINYHHHQIYVYAFLETVRGNVLESVGTAIPNRPLQASLNPPLAHAQGAINLTITNGKCANLHV